MKVIIFGATGMVGQGALKACLRDSSVTAVTLVGRTATGLSDPKVREVTTANLFDLSHYQAELSGYDACFYCLGKTSGGMDEASYTRITYDLTLGVAETLCRWNPGMTFIYVSGAGADSTEKGSTMWARVRGRTENALQRLPFKAVYVFRPSVIQPLDGIRSKTGSYRMAYAVLGPLLAPLRKLMPKLVLTTDSIGRGMIVAVRRGAPKPILEAADIYALTA